MNPQITVNDGQFNNRQTWSRTAGCLAVPANTNYDTFLLGSFAADSPALFGPAPPSTASTLIDQEAYYFIEDVQLRAFPTAGPNVAVTCGDVILGDGCALPTSSGGVYLWFAPGADPAVATPLQVSLTVTQYVVTPTQPGGLYTFVVRVPHPDRIYNAADPTSYYEAVTDALVDRIPWKQADARGPYVFGVGQQQPPAQLSGVFVGGTWTAVGSTLQLTPTGLVLPTTPVGEYEAIYTLYQPATGCTSSDVATVRVLPCELTTLGYDVDIRQFTTGQPNGPLVLSQNVFQPDTRYYIPATLELERDDFTLPKGCVLLMEADCRLVVGTDAKLTMAGGTVTAACVNQWLGIRVMEDSRGILATTTDQISTPPTPSDKLVPVNEISHAAYGLEIENAAQTPWHISSTAFKHNKNHLRLAPPTSKDIQSGQTTSKLNHVINCLFTSDPLEFKSPFSGLYSDIGIATNGWDVAQSPIAGNTFEHVLVGILAETANHDTTLADNRIHVGPANTFTNCYLGGIAMRGAAGGTVLEGNNMVLPISGTRPDYAINSSTAVELAKALAGSQTAGIYLTASQRPSAEPIVVRANTMTGAAPLPLLQAVGPQPLVGIWLRPGRANYQITDNQVADVATGLRLEPVRLALGNQAEVGANSFTNCTDGVYLLNTVDTRVGTATPLVWLRCNTFRRPTGGPNGLMRSIRLGSQTEVLLDDPTTPIRYTTMMKNRFEIDPARMSQTRFIVNENVNTLPVYTGYKTVAPTVGYVINLKDEIQQRSVNISARGQFQVPAGQQGQFVDIPYLDAYSCTRTDLIPNAGFNPTRPAPPTVPSGPSLPNGIVIGQNIPNPVIDETTISYALPNIHQADLIVREVMTGQVVRQQSLDTQIHTARLSVVGLRPGVYIYSVVADGVTVATRRLLVGR